ncbi:MAG: hypothetical protein A2452_06700 [Candidatus Firestonebacteria bacterium RIFOXYC2_FULL_39_67]|nr:MAG: hypothetical protein A2452_06700 [Candidatus Firestonebacteria bacterium RIFOXYC2_FULL_39_67]
MKLLNKGGLKYVIIAILVILLGTTGVILYHGHKSGEGDVKAVKYHCPMHPAYIADKPGDCPICGMKLVPMEKKEEGKKKTIYRSTMIPAEISDKPGKDSMGMDMVAEEVMVPAEPSTVPGLEKISITGEQEQLIGVKTEKVTKRNLTADIRASGRVAHDEELYNALSEYKQTLGTYADMKNSKISGENLKQTEEMLQSIRFKLAHMGVPAELADRMVKENKFSNLLYTNKSGGTVWIYAQVYDYEFGLIKEGQVIEASTTAVPGKKFKGSVISVGSYLDTETRTLRVRGEVENPGGLLKPEMYVDTLVHVLLGQKLAIPVTAVLDTGTRKVVFVKIGAGVYEPREIAAGAEGDNYYEVVSGVSEGEEVVTSANFLIDSECRLKSMTK